MSALVLDIETVPTDAAMAARPADEYVEDSRKQPSNLKDPAKIAEWHDKEAARQVEARAEWDGQAVTREAEYAKSCALNPRLGRIVVAGVKHADDNVASAIARTEDAEREVIGSAWEEIGLVGGQLITFNGLTFDLNFLVIRSGILGITPTVPFRTVRDWFRRYSFGPHYDTRAVLTQWDQRTTGTLSDWAACFGIPCDDTTKGSDIYALYQAGDFDAIAAHCRADVQTTAALYTKVAGLYGGCGSW